MARELDSVTPDVGAPDANNPQGTYLDEAAGIPGTPVLAGEKNSILYFFAKMMLEAAIAYDGNVDDITSSQFWDALEATQLSSKNADTADGLITFLAGLDVAPGGTAGKSVLREFYLEIGDTRSADGVSYIDLHASTTYPDNDTRLLRNSGANGTFDISQRGTGRIRLLGSEGASVEVQNDLFLTRAYFQKSAGNPEIIFRDDSSNNRVVFGYDKSNGKAQFLVFDSGSTLRSSMLLNTTNGNVEVVQDLEVTGSIKPGSGVDGSVIVGASATVSITDSGLLDIASIDFPSYYLEVYNNGAWRRTFFSKYELASFPGSFSTMITGGGIISTGANLRIVNSSGISATLYYRIY